MAWNLFNPRNEKSLNQRFRAKRFAFFKTLLKATHKDNSIRILDIGGTQSYWERMNFTEHDNVFITLLNLDVAPVNYANFTSVKGDACELKDFEDKHFDIVFSNSVIEHLFTWENQQKMAAEVRRVARSYYIQTPNYYFPIEPHWLFPFFHFLPVGPRVWLTQRFNMGHHPKSGNREAALVRVKEVQLLTPKKMQALFPEAKVYREIFMGLTKSITMYHFPG